MLRVDARGLDWGSRHHPRRATQKLWEAVNRQLSDVAIPLLSFPVRFPPKLLATHSARAIRMTGGYNITLSRLVAFWMPTCPLPALPQVRELLTRAAT